MGLFEDTLVKAKDVLDVAGKKTTEVYEIQKLKFKVAQVKSGVSKDFEVLGRLCYDNVKNDCENKDGVAKLVASIDDKYEEIAVLENELDGQKKNITCKNCGSKNIAGSSYCNRCGGGLK